MEKRFLKEILIKMENKIIKGDCLEVMKNIPDKFIDMILCDLPYGTTACSWDVIIPFDKLWGHYERIIKNKGVIVLFGSQPFTSALVMSNLKMFKYEWIWNKISGSNFMQLKKTPLKIHENILIFYKKNLKYNPIMQKGIQWKRGGKNKIYKNNIINQNFKSKIYNDLSDLKYPKSIQNISVQKSECSNSKRIHPTQKPVALFEYLIKTYTNEGDLVLDNCAGSGTTGVACKNLNRKFILIEKEEKYIKMIEERLEQQSVVDFTQNSTSSGFPTENFPNIILKEVDKPTSKILSNDETSLNNNIMSNLNFTPKR